MKITRLVGLSCSVALVLGLGTACQDEEKTPESAKPVATSDGAKAAAPAKPQPATKATTPAQPDAGHAAPGGKVHGVLTHGGLTFSVPAGWEPQIVEPGPLAAKASYKLPRDASDTGVCTVRVTHYPNMRGLAGMDDSNVNRWLSQVKKPDGSPMTRADAKIEKIDLGAVQVILVDLEGSVSVGMSGGGASASGRRMINAIVNHANGPHFIKALGPTASMANSADAIKAFIKSAKPAT